MTAAPPPVLAPPPPAALLFPAFPLPQTKETDFNHALENIIMLVTSQQRKRITTTAGVATAEDLL